MSTETDKPARKNRPAKTVPALRLQLGGAPEEWATVAGLPGHYHPTIAAPVGGEGELPLELAEAFIAQHDELVATARTEAKAFRAGRLEQGLADPGEFVDPVCPVELVKVTPGQADKARRALAELDREARRALRSSVKAGDVDQHNVINQDAALAGAKE